MQTRRGTRCAFLMSIDEPATLGGEYTGTEIGRAKEKRREFSNFVSVGCEFLHGVMSAPAPRYTNDAVASLLVFFGVRYNAFGERVEVTLVDEQLDRLDR